MSCSTLMASVIILSILSTIGCGSVSKMAQQDVHTMFADTETAKLPIITSEETGDLPEPVQRYLEFTNVLGKERIRTVRLKQEGSFRTKPDQKWFLMKATQHFNATSLSFVWHAKMKFFPLITVHARDKLHDGQAHMFVKLSSLKTLVDAKGAQLDQGALLRYLSEMVWFPTAFLEDYIEWAPIDASSAKATIRYGDLSAWGVFHFDEEGRIVRFTTDRYREVDGEFELAEWFTLTSDYREFDGILIPSKGEAAWHLDSGDFCYFRGEIVDVEYDSPLIGD